MKTKHIPVVKTARYFSLGEPSDKVEEIWYVAHGYGQLANYFLKWFEPIADEKRLIVAPEGMHRFYLKGTGGRVGASWMTKEDRLTDIEDYVTYLDGLDRKITDKISDPDKVKKVVLGFSQGTATVGRWVGFGDVDPDALVLWSGVMPHDMDIEIRVDKFKDPEVWMAYGDEDEYRDDSVIKNQMQVFEEMGVSAQMHEFKGGHKVLEQPLQELVRKIEG